VKLKIKELAMFMKKECGRGLDSCLSPGVFDGSLPLVNEGNEDILTWCLPPSCSLLNHYFSPFFLICRVSSLTGFDLKMRWARFWLCNCSLVTSASWLAGVGRGWVNARLGLSQALWLLFFFFCIFETRRDQLDVLFLQNFF
jgi:hypothetical protein